MLSVSPPVDVEQNLPASAVFVFLSSLAGNWIGQHARA
jgi:hypothetical protein